MLVHLQIRNFAIIDQLELDFAAGMSAITGETGAGKSIAVDALSLLLGDRADSSVIRHGAKSAELCALFDVSTLVPVQKWLQERELMPPDTVPDATGLECQLRRVISANGRSRCYINGSLQPLALLRELGEALADIHSQHEHQSLLRRDLQRQLLDDFGGHSTQSRQVRQHYKTWQSLADRLRSLAEGEAEREARKDLLRYQLTELQELDLSEDEPTQLAEEYQRLSNSGRLLEVTEQTLDQLYDNEQHALQNRLSRLQGELENLLELDNRLQPVTELLNNALVHIEEASHELRNYCQHIEQDPERLHLLEERLNTLHRLARKHRCQATELPQRQQELERELAELDSDVWDRDTLVKKTATAEAAYRSVATQLSQLRETTAQQLSQQVTRSMQTLGMQGGHFHVALTPETQPSSYGLEQIEFQVSANPGQPLRALAKVASGGELSRISLALQVIAANSTHIPTLIFDEVDSGIGGGVAETVGQLLRQLGAQRQILCVTHQPQVAAQAHHHLRVSKSTRNGSTSTQVEQLSQRQRVEELARMLGGRKLTAKTLAHAREMIQHAATPEQLSNTP